MELAKPEIAQLNKLVEDWRAHSTSGMEMELEAVFGAEGVVDATTFMAVAQRLQTKGYEPQPQDDRLSILLQNDLRVSIEGVGVISTLQDYCKDDTLDGKPFTIMSKSRRTEDSRLTIESYDFYIKNRVEEIVGPTDPRTAETLENWINKPKAFRLIKRWMFKGNGMRIDMSVVRSTPSLKGKFLWQKRFQENNIFKQPVRYEIEVELMRCPETETQAGALQCLVRGIGEILRGIQKNTFLIEKPVVERVLLDYRALNHSSSFRGVPPVTLEVKNMHKREEGGLETAENTPNIRDNYNVTEKADGLRVHLYCNPQGELFLIDMSMTVYKTGFTNKACADSLLDGEWVTRDKDGNPMQHVLIFDIYYLDGEDVSQLPFAVEDPEQTETRHVKMREWMAAWSTGLVRMPRGLTAATEFKIQLKKFVFAKTSNPNTIFAACQQVYIADYPYHTDGLILTPNALPLPIRSGETFLQQFKWKPAKDNTIDFLVRFEKSASLLGDKVDLTINPDDGETTRFKTLRLFVNSKKDPAYDNPRETVLQELELPLPEWKKRRLEQEQKQKNRNQGRGSRAVTKWQPSYFAPMDYPDPMAHICYLKIETDEENGDELVRTVDSQEPILEDNIVEMRYDVRAAPGWRWIPMRIRHDKTERFARAMATTEKNISRTLNAEGTAASIWNSIHNPVTVSMITTGSDKPTEAELAAYSRTKKYYNRQASKEDLKVIEGLRNFHNKWIKKFLLYAPTLAPGNKRLLDLTCGPGGDLDMWTKNHVDFVLGVDLDKDNIRDPRNGIYARYLNYLVKFGREKMPIMLFAQGDSSRRLINGGASTEQDDANILRSVFAKEAVTEELPPYVKTYAAAKLKDGADVASCMFALHYFFKDMETLNGFLTNLQETVKVGGYFIGCCTDGEKAFELLREYEEGGAAVGKEEDLMIWSIRKGYDLAELVADESSVGLPIDVEFISIGEEHREYLVHFEYLKKRLTEIGFELVPKAELPGGLQHSTNLFEATYKAVPNAKAEYPMSEVVQRFSFLSRWFVFKRRGEAEVAEVASEVVLPGINVVLEGKEPDEPEPKAAATAAAATALPTADHVFAPAELFQFGAEVGVKDTLRVGEDRAAKILAPYWPFPIADEEDGTEYPSVEHYYNAMLLKHGAKNPDLAITLLSSDKGSIHRSALRLMEAQKLVGATLSKEKKLKQLPILLNELIDLKNQMSPATLAADYKTVIDASAWDKIKDYHLRRALQMRWTKDKMFRTIVEKARAEKKYLLYYISRKIGDPTGEFAGRLNEKTGRIEGENKVGKMIMELANFAF
jgi:SAM-dependent methyltransferase